MTCGVAACSVLVLVWIVGGVDGVQPWGSSARH